mgnify:CR=1 FL=1|tara:strand:- start:35 stop:244 length:210 start_codon:yes stop_codon:yes gene_type:complete
MKNLKGYFKSTKEQKANQKLIFEEFVILLGAVMLGHGIVQIIPSEGSFLIGLGLTVFILGVIMKNTSRT